MLPNVRLLIAAMLASILVLICGFGVFAAFRVSRDPIAHLPVAAPPSQLLAETRAASSAVMVAGEIADQHSRFDIPVSALEETAAPTGTTERHDQASLSLSPNRRPRHHRSQQWIPRQVPRPSLKRRQRRWRPRNGRPRLPRR
jgi:hypothetical protein